MHYAIRDWQTGMFYSHEVWTAGLRFAQSFPDLDSVDDLVSIRRLENAEAVFVSNDGECEAACA
jgi:hypothetical protein